jgi:hypothetical protein
MLSRVKTINGLYARLPLQTDILKYSVKPVYEKMIRAFQAKSPVHFTEEDYQSLFAIHSIYASSLYILILFY